MIGISERILRVAYWTLLLLCSAEQCIAMSPHGIDDISLDRLRVLRTQSGGFASRRRVAHQGNRSGVGRSFFGPSTGSAVPISAEPRGAQYWPVLPRSKSFWTQSARDSAATSGVTAPPESHCSISSVSLPARKKGSRRLKATYELIEAHASRHLRPHEPRMDDPDSYPFVLEIQ